MENSAENLIRAGEEKTIPESELKKIVNENISGYVDGKLKELEQKFETKIENKETKTTEILAIFITLFTFISANITIFTKVTDIKRAVFFMLFMTLCSTSLLSFTFISINQQKKNIFQWIGLLCSIGLMVLMLFGIYLTPIWNIRL